MTGFGRGEFHNDSLSANVELSSVNRKQADVQITLPRGLSELEAELRKKVLASISRGRVSVTITLTQTQSAKNQVQIDLGKTQALETAFSDLSKHLGREVKPTASDFLNVPDLLISSNKTFIVEEAIEVISPALDQALSDLLEMRSNEGKELLKDFKSRLETLLSHTQEIETFSPTVVDRYRAILMKRLEDIGIDVDLTDERVLREIALFAERSDISEETTRLHAHFARFHDLLDDTNKPVGRPLDFLCQEINREFNTIGSKANSSDIATHVVSAKTELEKIREQVQNIE